MNQKIIALVDCNSFYCSCERLFRPDLNNKPVVVLSNNDGCAISRTNEAKALGIKMGDPYFKIKYLCRQNKVHIFSSNFSLYTNISDRVMRTLIKLCPKVDIYSVDEAFLDLSGMQKVTEFSHMVKQTLLDHVGIPVGIGVGPTKVLAKIANRLAKKSLIANGVVNLCEKKFQDIGLARVEIGDVWGIGAASAMKLQTLGIKTAKDFRDYPNDKLIQAMLTKVGLQIKHELMGITCFPFNKPVEAKKEIMCSRTFGGSVNSKDVLKESIANYVSDAAKKLRSQNSLCQELSVFARTNPFKMEEQFYLFESKKLISPTANTLRLIKIAHELIDRSYRDGYDYKKAGIRLNDFYTSVDYQLDLFSSEDSKKETDLMKVIDRINAREGEQTVRSGACGISDEAWKMNRNFKSPRYTTAWSELKKFD